MTIQNIQPGSNPYFDQVQNPQRQERLPEAETDKIELSEEGLKLAKVPDPPVEFIVSPPHPPPPDPGSDE